MTHISQNPTVAAGTDYSRWTGAKAACFLKALAKTGEVAAAARAVGMSRQAAYRLRARAPEFARVWEMALEQALAQRAERCGRGRGRGRRAAHPLLARHRARLPDTAGGEA